MSQSTTIPRHVLNVHGSLLGADLRNALRTLGYTPAAVREAVDSIGINGTATGSCVEAEDLDLIEGLIVKHTSGVEYESAENWPSWTDQGQWITTAAVDAPGEPDPTPEGEDDHLWNQSRPYEPTTAERIWVSSKGQVDLFPGQPWEARDFDAQAAEARALDLLAAGLEFTPAPICGGAPAETRLYPDSWMKAVRNYTDGDQRKAFGCV